MGMAKDELGVEIKPEEIEIAHRVGQARNNNETTRSQGNLKPRSIIVKFTSNKTKMKLLKVKCNEIGHVCFRRKIRSLCKYLS